MTEVPGWPLPQKVLVYLLHFYLQELLMGISSNMTIFLGFLAWSFILFDLASFFSFFSSFPYTLSSCLFLSPSCLSCYCLIWWWAVVARYRRKKKKATIWNRAPNVTRVIQMANKEQVVPWEFISLPPGCCCFFSILWYLLLFLTYIWLENCRSEISGEENNRLVCDTVLFDMEKYWDIFFSC